MFGDVRPEAGRWPTVRLDELVGEAFRNGLSPSTTGSVPGKVLTLSAITGTEFNADESKEALFDREPSANQRVSRDTFLICRGNGNKNLVGIGRFPRADDNDMTFPDTMIGATIDAQQMVPTFFQTIWNSTVVRDQIERVARTTNGTYKVNQGSLGSIVLVCPEFAIQREFDAQVQLCSNQRSSFHRLLKNADELFLSLQQRAFRGEL